MSEGTKGLGRGRRQRRLQGGEEEWGAGGVGRFTLFCDQRTECRLEGWKKKKEKQRGERVKVVGLHGKMRGGGVAVLLGLLHVSNLTTDYAFQK